MVLKQLITANGLLYEVESGSDPYYPRGAVTPISKTSIKEHDEEDDDDVDFDDANAVRAKDMDEPLRNFVLCAVSYCRYGL